MATLSEATGGGVRLPAAWAGPWHWVTDVSPENIHSGIVAYITLLPCVFAFPLKPHWATGAITALGTLSWLFVGLIGLGIGC